MKLYFIISVFVFIAAVTETDYSDILSENLSADTLLKCPVTGDDIQGEYVTFRYIDEDIKFCSDGCVLAYKKEPAKFSQHVKCIPCNEDDASHKIYTTQNGVKYYFCSQTCRSKFEEKPGEYLEKFMK